MHKYFTLHAIIWFLVCTWPSMLIRKDVPDTTASQITQLTFSEFESISPSDFFSPLFLNNLEAFVVRGRPEMGIGLDQSSADCPQKWEVAVIICAWENHSLPPFFGSLNLAYSLKGGKESIKSSQIWRYGCMRNIPNHKHEIHLRLLRMLGISVWSHPHFSFLSRSAREIWYNIRIRGRNEREHPRRSL